MTPWENLERILETIFTYNLVYLMLTKFILCFVTTLVTLHFLPCILIMFPLFFVKNAEKKAIRKHKPPSHWTKNLKSKTSCGKSFYEGFPRKKGKLNMITSTVANKYAIVRSYGSSSMAGLSFSLF